MSPALPFVRVKGGPRRIEWEDETGRTGSADRAPVGVAWPAALVADLARARDRLWRQQGDRYHSGDPVTLAVYVQGGPDDGLGDIPPALAEGVTRVEALPAPAPRDPPSLPLRIVAATPDVAGVVGRLTVYPGLLPVPAGPDWWRTPADVLITGRPPTRAPSDPVRLLIAPPSTRPEPWMDALLQAPVHTPDGREAVVQLAVAITHDLPLHDAMREGIAAGLLPPGTRLWASPESDHALRLSLLAARLAEAALAPRSRQERWSPELSPPEVRHRSAQPLSFDRESGGLRGLASAVQAMELSPRRALLGLTGRTRASRRPSGRREADLRLLRPDGLVAMRAHRGLRTPGDLAWVGPRTTLVAGQRYRLRFQIGASLPGNLLTGPSPDFDELLAREPSRRGHELTVVLYPQDFRAGDDAGGSQPVIQPLHLPVEGPSAALLFPVTATRPGRLRLRVSVYHRGSMLASFRLQARVTEEERDGRAAVRAWCDYRRGDAFADPRPHERRDLHLSVNASGGVHDLMVLDPDGTPTAAAARASVKVVGAFLDEARRILAPMAQTPAYRLHLTPDAPPTRLAGDLHALAKLGQKLYLGVLQGNLALRPALKRVQKGADHHVQAVRHPDAPALPWALTYDWQVPEIAPPEVCLGLAPGGRPCAHDATSVGVVCARGFWGVRHRIEERVDNQADWPEVLPGGPVVLALDPDNAYWKAAALAPAPAGVTLVPSDTPVLAALATPDRPAVFAILGHHATSRASLPGPAGAGAPAGATVSSLEVGPAGREVRLADLENLAAVTDWADPTDGRRPLVLLMACETGVGQERDVYVDYVAPLLVAGAAGVVTTETVAPFDLLGWTTRRLVDRLLAGAPLSTALRDARAALLQERYNPLGFLFSALADGDLHLPGAP